MVNTGALSRGLIRDGVSFSLITAMLVFGAGCSSGGGGGDGEGGGTTIVSTGPDAGIFRFQILESEDPELIFSDIFRSDTTSYIGTAVSFANQVVSLPGNDMPIYFTRCNESNAYFNPNVPEIVMCYELVSAFYNQYQTLYGAVEGFENPDAFAYVSAFSAFNFVLYHEIAHALHFTLELGIAGNSESAADGIATVLAVEQNRADFPLLAAILLLQSDNSSFEDVHSGGLDRGGDILCWTLGGDAELASDENYAGLVSSFVDAGRDCAGEYAAQRFAVFGWLPQLENQTTLAAASTRGLQSPNGLKNLDSTAKRELADLLSGLLVGKI